jgi:hypothetical protein
MGERQRADSENSCPRKVQIQPTLDAVVQFSAQTQIINAVVTANPTRGYIYIP